MGDRAQQLAGATANNLIKGASDTANKAVKLGRQIQSDVEALCGPFDKDRTDVVARVFVFGPGITQSDNQTNRHAATSSSSLHKRSRPVFSGTN